MTKYRFFKMRLKHFRMKKFAALFVLVLLCALHTDVSFAHAAGKATMVLSKTNVSVKTGEAFDLILYVNPNGEILDSVRAEINFTPGILELTSFEVQKQFPNASPGNVLNNTTGFTSFGSYRFGSAVTYSGKFALLHFRALASGSATIAVAPTSKLITDGEEMSDASNLSSTAVSVDGAAYVAPPAVTSSQKELEKRALVYFGAFYGRMPKYANDWSALKCFANGGCKGSPRDIASEQKSLITFGAKYKKMPATSMEWNVVDTLAYTSYLKAL